MERKNAGADEDADGDAWDIRAEDVLAEIEVENDTILREVQETVRGVQDGQHAVVKTVQVVQDGQQEVLETVRDIRRGERTVTAVSNVAMPQPLCGRDALVQDVCAMLETPGAMVALVGPPGVGKSSCAEEIARRFGSGPVAAAGPEAEDNGKLVWVLRAETEEAIRQDYADLLDAVGDPLDPRQELSTQQVAACAGRALRRRTRPWLLVFDNAPDEGPARLVPWFFPSMRGLAQHGRVLLTSRCAGFRGDVLCGGEGHVVQKQVRELDESAGAEVLLVEHQAVSDEERHAARQLSEMVGGLPLALRVARKVARAEFREDPVQQYLSDLVRGGAVAAEGTSAVDRLLRRPFELLADDPVTMRVVGVVLCLSPDRIPLSLLQRCVVGDGVGAPAQRQVLERVEAVGLLQEEDMADARVHFSIHRRLQSCGRELGHHNVSAASQVLSAELARFDDGDSDTWAAVAPVVPHALAFVESVAATWPTLERDDVGSIADRVLVPLADWHRCTFGLAQADALARQALTMLRHIHGPEASHESIATALLSMGRIQLTLDRLDDAETHLGHALDMMRVVHGPDERQSEIARVLHHVGRAKYIRGDLDGAQAMYDEALEMTRHVYGSEARNTDIAGTLHNLAIVKKDRGDLDGAQAMYDEALEMKRHVYGSEARNTDIARTLQCLGNVHGMRGSLGTAERLFTQALDMVKHVHGAHTPSPDSASLLAALGDVSFFRNDMRQALHMYESALGMMKRMYGAQSAEIARITVSLGMAQQITGDLVGAEASFAEALRLQRRLYGPDASHSLIAEALHNLGSVRYERGDLEGAESMLGEALAMRRHVHGMDGPRAVLTAATLRLRGDVQLERGNADAAVSALRETTEMLTRALGENARNDAMALRTRSMGLLKQHQGDLDAAHAMFLDALQMLRSAHGPDVQHADIAKTLYHLATLQLVRRDLESAETAFRDALEMQRRVCGPDTYVAVVGDALHGLGLIRRARGDWEGAESMFMDALSAQRRLMGGEAPSLKIARTLKNLGGVQKERGDLDGAESSYLEALEVKLRVYGGPDERNADLRRTTRCLEAVRCMKTGVKETTA